VYEQYRGDATQAGGVTTTLQGIQGGENLASAMHPPQYI